MPRAEVCDAVVILGSKKYKLLADWIWYEIIYKYVRIYFITIYDPTDQLTLFILIKPFGNGADKM